MREHSIINHGLIHDRMHKNTIHEDMHKKNIHTDMHIGHISDRKNNFGINEHNGIK